MWAQTTTSRLDGNVVDPGVNTSAINAAFGQTTSAYRDFTVIGNK